MTDFYKRKESLDGYHNACKECFCERSRAWYDENAEHVKARVKQWTTDNRDQVRKRYRTDPYRAKMREYRARNRDKINSQMRQMRASDPERFRKYDLKRRLRKFGVALEEYEALLDFQGGACAICQGAPNGRGDDIFHFDHDHETGVLRGLLCHYCNTSLGGFRDDPAVLRRAIAYLAEPPFQRVGRKAAG